MDRERNSVPVWARVRQLKEQIEAVQKLHEPMWIPLECPRPLAGCGGGGCEKVDGRFAHAHGFQICTHCSDTGDPYHVVSDEWPCPTIKAIEEVPS